MGLIFDNTVKGKLEDFEILYNSKHNLIQCKKVVGRATKLADVEELENIIHMKKAIFFDRDGVLIVDNGYLSDISAIEFREDLFPAFGMLNTDEFDLFMVTNQPIIARGLATEQEIDKINEYIVNHIYSLTNVKFKHCYYCPHHPDATLERYKMKCDCRKPAPGMLLNAASEYDINLSESWMIGDRMSDVNAGAKAGCRTILLQSGRHLDAPIVSDLFDSSIEPDFTCRVLTEAIRIIKNEKDSVK